MTDMHIPEERFYELVMAGSPLSESEFSHLGNCEHCIDVFANIAREIVQKRIENGNPAIEPPENTG